MCAVQQQQQPDYQPEIIYVNKVYNECSVADCTTYRIPIPPTFPTAVNVVDCEITDVFAEGIISGVDTLDFTVNFVMNVEYDSNGRTEFIQQTGQYRTRGVRLRGALPGMNAVVLPLIRCLSCEPVDGGTVIECLIGVYIVVKAVALVQLEVMGRFAPEPPACEQVSPIGCTEWFDLVESGQFWPPFPPQPTNNNGTNNTP